MAQKLLGLYAIAAATSHGDATNTTAVRRYLKAVYPAADFEPLDDARVAKFYESLDYYYDCNAERLAKYRPPVRCRNNAPVLPYVAPGIYYSAGDATTDERNVGAGGLRGSFTRWQALMRNIRTRTYTKLYATYGGRLGPAPSWTHVAAVVKYPLYPLGLDESTLPNTIVAKPVDALRGIWDTPTRRRKFSTLKTGDYLEVEQFGGADWVTSEFPTAKGAIPGLFCNIWRGSGTFLRVVAPFVSRSKGSAVADLLKEIGSRGGHDHLSQIAKLASIDIEGSAPEQWADALSVGLLALAPPCDSDGWTMIGPHWRDWRKRTIISKPATFGPVEAGTRWRFARDPSLSASELRLETSSGDASLGLHWINGLCARGPHFPKKYRRMCLRKERMTRRSSMEDNATLVEAPTDAEFEDLKRKRRRIVTRRAGACKKRWLAWDNLLMVLSCCIGAKTLILDQSPNDNGLYHEELVDYDVPGSWVTIEDDALNPIDVCLAPFRDGTETPTKGQVLTHWKSTKKWALVDPLTGAAAPCRLVARGVGRFAACKGSAAEFVAPITMRHRLPFAHYAAPYAAVLACKAADECSEFCDQAGLCTA